MEYSYSLRERVERGAELLDDKKPGWAAEVALYGDLTADAMSQNSCYSDRCGCVLARNFTTYWRGLDELGIDFTSSAFLGFNASKHLIDSNDIRGMYREYIELAILWNEQVKLRVEQAEDFERSRQ